MFSHQQSCNEQKAHDQATVQATISSPATATAHCARSRNDTCYQRGSQLGRRHLSLGDSSLPGQGRPGAVGDL